MTKLSAQIRLVVVMLLLLLQHQLVLLPTHAGAVHSTSSAEPAHIWMRLVYDLVKIERLSPPVAARLYAYSSITLYESLVAEVPDQRSLAGQLNGLTSLPVRIANVTYDWQIVSAVAMDIVLNDLLLRPLNTSRQSIQHVREAMLDERRSIVTKEVFNASIQHGEALGETILAWASNDRFMFTRGLVYSVPIGDPSLWVGPTADSRPVEPYWGRIRPFVLSRVDACHVALDIPYSTHPDSLFYAQAQEVKQTGETLTEPQRQIAEFWADQAGITSTPPGHWVSIAMQVARQQQLSREKTVMLYAMLNIAAHDAFVSAWDLKYRVNLLRPDTYINQNISSTWSPLLPTPLFPEYPSGHSVGSGTAATVLKDMLGDVEFTDNTHIGRLLGSRTFTSFNDAAEEAAISRLYGGIHFRAAIDNGLVQGRCIGRQALHHIDFFRSCERVISPDSQDIELLDAFMRLLSNRQTQLNQVNDCSG